MAFWYAISETKRLERTQRRGCLLSNHPEGKLKQKKRRVKEAIAGLGTAASVDLGDLHHLGPVLRFSRVFECVNTQ